MLHDRSKGWTLEDHRSRRSKESQRFWEIEGFLKYSKFIEGREEREVGREFQVSRCNQNVFKRKKSVSNEPSEPILNPCPRSFRAPRVAYYCTYNENQELRPIPFHKTVALVDHVSVSCSLSRVSSSSSTVFTVMMLFEIVLRDSNLPSLSINHRTWTHRLGKLFLPRPCASARGWKRNEKSRASSFHS